MSKSWQISQYLIPILVLVWSSPAAIEAQERQATMSRAASQVGKKEPPSSCPTNLIINGSFEAMPNGQGWTAVTEPGFSRVIEVQRNAVVLASVAGTAHAELASDGPTKISQKIRTTDGASYRLVFAYRPRPGYDSKAVVRWNQKVVLNLPVAADPADEWLYYTVQVTGTGEDTVVFEDTSRRDSGGAFIDDVRLCPAASQVGKKEPPPSCPTNLIVNGSFEVMPNGQGWTAVTEPGFSRVIEVQRNAVVLASVAGTAHAELASDGPTKISQKIRTTDGASYRLVFAYRPRPGYDSKAVVRWNQKVVLNLPVAGDPANEWLYYTVQVTGTGEDTVVFEDTSRRDSGGAFIDDVRLCPAASQVGKKEPPPSCPTNLIVNGSFEVMPNGQGWTAVTEPGFSRVIEVQRNAVVLASVAGTAHAELASDGPTKISQKIRTTDGASYRLVFAYRPRPGYDSKAVVRWNQKVVLNLPVAGDAANEWLYYTVEVRGTGEDTVVFEDTSRRDSGGAFIDDVRLCPAASQVGRKEPPSASHENLIVNGRFDADWMTRGGTAVNEPG